PFVILGGGAEAERSAVPEDVFASLRQACRSPLGKWLPDDATVRSLDARLQAATGRIAEIDAALSRPEFSEPAAIRPQEGLRGQGASESALSATRLRLQNIRRLRSVRDRFTRELEEVRELVAQLVTQAEVTRLAGGADGALSPLVHELSCRIEGLEQMVCDDMTASPPAPG